MANVYDPVTNPTGTEAPQGYVNPNMQMQNIPATGAATPPQTTTPAPQASPTPSPIQPQPMQQAPVNAPKPGGTQETVQGASPALQMPASGSIVDLLNMAGVDSSSQNRAVLAKQFGVEGYSTKGGTAAQNQDLAKKFLEAYNKSSSVPTPETSAAGRSGVLDLMEQTAPKSEEDVQANFFDAYSAMNPVEKSLFDAINQAISTPVTKQSFLEEFQQLQAEQGVPALRTELLNIKRIMDGTEDDIRDEIIKGGGFATESQVQAMTGARNKTLLKQATNLADQLDVQEDYVDRLMEFSQMDRKDVEEQADRKLGLREKMMALQDKMTSAAKGNYEKIVTASGFDGLATLLQNDPKEMARAEKAMGLPAGTPKNEAFLAKTAKEDLQFISGTANQASGVFDKRTGKFTPTGGGGPSPTGATPMGNLDPVYQSALNTILGSEKLTKDQKNTLTASVMNSKDPFTVLKNKAKDIMGQTSETELKSYEDARRQMTNIQDSLQRYYAAGGKTNIFRGNYEKVIGKLGDVDDPELRELATEIESALQLYRNAVSGTAYSVQEGNDIASIFPGIDKTSGLNKAILNARLSSFDEFVDGSYEQYLGQDYYRMKELAQSGQQTKTVTISGQQVPVGSIITNQKTKKRARVNADGSVTPL